MIFLYTFFSVLFVSSLSLLGALFLVLNRKTYERLITYSLSLSSGVLLGSVFFDLIPESFQEIGNKSYTFVVVGMISFFIIEKFINWHRHVARVDSATKPAAYLSLIGDGIHNFLDGIIVAVAFLTSFPLGIITTLAVIAHEIPHELGDFTILIDAGLKSKTALFYNFLSALTAVLGVIFIFIFSQSIVSITPYFIGFAAGNFLYIAASDLIPELHQKRLLTTSIIQTLCITGGAMLMWVLSGILG